ncbi:MAG: SDR family oxidoreductase [Pseudomonadota bacterium]|nr:SDR family oxidoreductase [Pseudomonadota bacterium]
MNGKVLVTGSAGYIGSVLMPMLRDTGHDAVGLDSCVFERSRLPVFEDEGPMRVMDVRDIGIRDLEGFDAIIHLAGMSNDPLGSHDPEVTDDINHVAAVSLARKAKQAGVDRFVFASSCSNYGAFGDDWITEDSGFRPQKPYADSKVAAEEGMLRLADDHFCPVFMRASTAYGVSPMLRFDLVVNNLTAWAIAKKRVYLKSTGNAWRPVVHIEDISRAYIAAMEAPREDVFCESFNIGTTAENYRVSELAEIVEEVVGDCVIDYAPDARPDPSSYRVDCNKIARVLPAFKPQWTMRRGVAELVDLYRRFELDPADFEGPRFQRLAHLQDLMARGLLTKDWRVTGAGARSVAG